MAIPGYYSLLQRGSSGPDVALVQTWLNGVRDECTWYDALKADGKFGASTQRAVQEFQLKNKMNMDGKVGQNTWNVLYTRYTAKHGLKVPYPGIVLRSGIAGRTGCTAIRAVMGTFFAHSLCRARQGQDTGGALPPCSKYRRGLAPCLTTVNYTIKSAQKQPIAPLMFCKAAA